VTKPETMRRRRGMCIMYGRRWAENTTKRRLTQKAAARITHIGAPAAIIGTAASWALPA
jgi:hypothetical protein